MWLSIGRWFSPGTPVSSTNRTDRHAIAEILLKVALNTITPTQLAKKFDIQGIFNGSHYIGFMIYLALSSDWKKIFNVLRTNENKINISSKLWKDSLNSVGQQFHQCQQKKQSALAITPKKTTTYYVGNPGPGLGHA
jgi:hypothetical protein